MSSGLTASSPIWFTTICPVTINYRALKHLAPRTLPLQGCGHTCQGLDLLCSCVYVWAVGLCCQEKRVNVGEAGGHWSILLPVLCNCGRLTLTVHVCVATAEKRCKCGVASVHDVQHWVMMSIVLYGLLCVSHLFLYLIFRKDTFWCLECFYMNNFWF